jgi:DNA adenine methylase
MGGCIAKPRSVGRELVYPPLLRWAGSKRATASSLAQFWRPQFGKYIEPFCGSAALFFKLAPEKAVLADINRELVVFYETVSTRPVEVYRKFYKIPRKRDVYYRLRGEYREISDTVLRAAIFYYLNKNCFNGLYRTNKQGTFNVPFSDSRVGRYPSAQEFIQSYSLLSRAQFRCGDFVEVVEGSLRAGDFVYLDPPYASSKRLPFREYHPDSFGVKDIDRLERLLLHIDKCGAHFVLTYGDNRAIRNIAKCWIRSTCRVRRNISGFSAARRMATEQVITNIRALL